MITKKKYFALTLCLILILACSIILAGCGEVGVYGKKFSYQGEINVSWSSLHEENGKGIENIITNQMKADNIDWSQTGFDEEIRDLTSLNFKNGKEALEHFKEEFNKVVEPHTQGLLLTFGTEEEKILTVVKLQKIRNSLFNKVLWASDNMKINYLMKVFEFLNISIKKMRY